MSISPTSTEPFISTQPSPHPEGLRERRRTPQAATVESDYSDSLTEVDPAESLPDLPSFEQFIDDRLGDLLLLDALTPPRRHRGVGALKGPGAQALIAAGTATLSGVLSIPTEQTDRATQGLLHLMMAGATLAAASFHGSLRYAGNPPPHNNEIWRASCAGAALGIVATDVLQMVRGGPRSLLPGFSLQPAPLISLLGNVGAVMFAQQKDTQHHAPSCEVGALMRQLGRVPHLLFAPSMMGAVLTSAWLDPEGADKTISTPQAWSKLVRHPAGALSLAALVGGTIVSIRSSSTPFGRFVSHQAPLLLLLASYTAVVVASREI